MTLTKDEIERSISSARPKYRKGEVIVHYKGGVYLVLLTPADGIVLEATGVPAYLYSKLTSDGIDSAKWVRRADEIEEAERFKATEDGFVINVEEMHNPDFKARMREIIVEDDGFLDELIKLIRASEQ